MHVEIQQEHRWLQKFVGEWTFETEASMEPGAPPIKFKGTETVRSIGDIWVQCEGRGEMPGGGTQITIMTLGYDPSKRRFVGTFLGSMMTFLWIYDGQLDAAGKATFERRTHSYRRRCGCAASYTASGIRRWRTRSWRWRR